MWEPNEQLLLRAPVRYKKHEGTLFVTPRRVAWQQQGSSQLIPSIHYNDIGGLAQTPQSSPKILLKISVTAPVAKDYTFHFTSLKALQEREAIKSQVTELLARARGTSSSAVGTPRPITPTASMGVPSPMPATPPVTNSPSVQPPLETSSAAALQKPSTPIITNTPSQSAVSSPTSQQQQQQHPARTLRQEEFADRKALLTSSKELQTLHKELVVVGKSVSEEEFWASPYIKRIRQKLKRDAVSREGKQKGRSSRMVELKASQQEGSDVKYTLTSQIIHNIFTEFPSVKRAYDTNVPDKMSEQIFWKRFLASEFFHRSRTGGRPQLTPYDDIFDKCLQEEDEENSKPQTITRMDRIRFDIDLTATLEDHIESGNRPDFTMIPGREKQALPLIRRFNRHSSRVLETPPSKLKLPEPTATEEIEKDIILTDLVEQKPPEKIELDIQDTKRYFESQTGGSDQVKLNEEDTKKLLEGYKHEFENWRPDLVTGQDNFVKKRVADAVCEELTDTIKKKARYNEKSATDMRFPPQVQSKIHAFHMATNELLRHFWSSWEPYRADKNQRMVESLKRQKDKLKEVLISVVSFQGDPEKCKQTLMPDLQAVDRALETSQKRVNGRKKLMKV
ncbi:hypothetical protein BDF20DRAFT_863451 [Mycotypha africana]|uniref:uncharacterized protein n=1 Tax=Mycotypha africana TaxID=64632 RepID=UPI0023004F82|nr:uncharacterized protein BDF20DRAFT_863451 [Mycotypha africana]KAI8981827.1 hypothetical protein BDF20DRAFT_863451 [Mycotypha africana]